MPNDIWYGADCEMRIGRRANATTPPTVWQAIDFMSMTMSPVREWRERPKLGVPGTRLSVLDPIKPREGLYRLTGEVVVDADARTFPLWLRHGMGPEDLVSAGPLYTHTFNSGSKLEQYFDIALRVGAADFRLFQGLTLAQISLTGAGENVADLNINLSLRGLTQTAVTAWPTGTLTPAVVESPMYRATFAVDDVIASNILNASITYDRQLQEDLYLSGVAAVSGNRPNGGAHSGSANFRALGAVFDTMEGARTVFQPKLSLNGMIAGHSLIFQHPTALMTPSPLPISGPGSIDRTLNWSAFQTAVTPALRIQVVNDVPAYA